LQKPKGDPREYQHAVLENGLRVVNIWDPNTTQAAVSVAVTVGSFSDPEGFDGLAHLTEHAMFLGSENYPQQSGFDIWLAQHGGSSNAYTAEEQTVYYVSTSEKAFEQCLRRFADVFRAPLFNASWIWDEVRAVDSEHNKNRKSQEWQVHQLINFMAADGSQMGRFHTGNEHTLRRTNKEKLASKIQGFFSANYCPPRMRLVTFGPQSLEEQLAKARATFGNIPRGTCRTEAPSFESPEAFPQRSLQKMLRMQGMSTMPELHLVFPMANLQPWARNNPTVYLQHVLAYGGDNSLLLALRDRLGVASSVSVSAEDASAGSKVTVSMSLLPEGVEKLPVVLDAFFAFLNRARNSTLAQKSEVLRSLAETAQLGYDWAALEDATHAVYYMADDMTKFGPSELMVAGSLILEQDVQKVEALLERLRPERMNVVLVDGSNSEYWREPPDDARPLPHYDVNYTARPLELSFPEWKRWLAPEDLERLPVSLDQRLAEVKPTAALNLLVPGAIEGLPRVSLTPRATAGAGVLGELWGQSPRKLASNLSLAELWHREGWILRHPRLTAQLSLRGAQHEADATDVVASEIGLRMLSELLSARLAHLAETGTSFKVAAGHAGFSLRLSSFAEKATEHFAQVLQQLLHPQEEAADAARRLERLARELQLELEDHSEAAINVAVREREVLLSPNLYSRAEMLNALRGRNLSAGEALQSLAQRRQGNLSATGLVMGSCSPEDAVRLQETLLKQLDVGSQVELIPTNSSERVERVLRPAGPVELRGRNPRGDSSNVMLMSILVGTTSIQQRVLLSLIADVLFQTAFAVLRTQLQLGYEVGGTVSAISNVLTVSCYVQSEVASPDLSEQHCEKVLSVDMPLALEQIGDDDFKSLKESFRLALLQPPLSTTEEEDRFWTPILLGRCFEVTQTMLEYLESVKLSDVVAAWRGAVMPEKVREKVVIKLFGSNHQHQIDREPELSEELADAVKQRLRSERRAGAVLRGSASSALRKKLVAMGAGYFPQTLSCTLGDASSHAEDSEAEATRSLIRRA